MSTLHIRWAVRRDVSRLVVISDASFIGGWGEADFLRCLAVRNCICMAAEQDEVIKGFTVYELFPDRVQLLNFAVCPSARRQGIGTALLAKMKYKLCSHRREKLTVTVRESSDTALLFFRAGGLKAVAIDRECFDGELGIRLEYRPTFEEWEEFGFAPPLVNRLAAYGV